MYNLDKLCFANHADELIRMRIPQATLFLLGGNKLCTYSILAEHALFEAFNKEQEKLDKYKQVKNTANQKHIVDVLDKATLLDKRYYYFSTKDFTIGLKPRIINRKYRWSIDLNDFELVVVRGDNKKANHYFHTKMVFGDAFQYPRALLCALHDYYIGDNHSLVLENDKYFLGGKYFVTNNEIIYNDFIIGKLDKEGNVSIKPKYSKWFGEDFIV